jgi:hypothetical protein
MGDAVKIGSGSDFFRLVAWRAGLLGASIAMVVVSAAEAKWAGVAAWALAVAANAAALSFHCKTPRVIITGDAAEEIAERWMRRHG